MEVIKEMGCGGDDDRRGKMRESMKTGDSSMVSMGNSVVISVGNATRQRHTRPIACCCKERLFSPPPKENEKIERFHWSKPSSFCLSPFYLFFFLFFPAL